MMSGNNKILTRFLPLIFLVLLTVVNGCKDNSSDEDNSEENKLEDFLPGEWAIVDAGGDIGDELNMGWAEQYFRFKKGGECEWCLNVERDLCYKGTWENKGDTVKLKIMHRISFILLVDHIDKSKIQGELTVYEEEEEYAMSGPVVLAKNKKIERLSVKEEDLIGTWIISETMHGLEDELALDYYIHYLTFDENNDFEWCHDMECERGHWRLEGHSVEIGYKEKDITLHITGKKVNRLRGRLSIDIYDYGASEGEVILERTDAPNRVDEEDILGSWTIEPADQVIEDILGADYNDRYLSYNENGEFCWYFGNYCEGSFWSIKGSEIHMDWFGEDITLHIYMVTDNTIRGKLFVNKDDHELGGSIILRSGSIGYAGGSERLEEYDMHDDSEAMLEEEAVE